MDHIGSNLKDKERAQSRNEALRAKGESKESEDEQFKIQQVIQQPQNSETSLRHLFYLEYKKNF